MGSPDGGTKRKAAHAGGLEFREETPNRGVATSLPHCKSAPRQRRFQCRNGDRSSAIQNMQIFLGIPHGLRDAAPFRMAGHRASLHLEAYEALRQSHAVLMVWRPAS